MTHLNTKLITTVFVKSPGPEKASWCAKYCIPVALLLYCKELAIECHAEADCNMLNHS